MPYDNTCKFLAETFSADIATWLLGEPVALTKLEPKELSLEPIRADSLILLQSEQEILHCEFQTNPVREVPFRMADYKLRGYRCYPNKEMRQVVIYLRKTSSPLVYQNNFSIFGLRCDYEVIRLWEQPTELFLELPGLLPFACLSKTDNQEQVLREVARRTQTLPLNSSTRNIIAASAVLAGLVLKKDFIWQVLRQDIMRESVIYQEIEAEAEARGEARGLAIGEARGETRGLAIGEARGEARGLALKAQEIALSLLKTGMKVQQVAQVTGLSLERVLQLQGDN